jgi:hypothetical protein
VLFDQYANWSVQVSDVYQGRGVITEVHRESIESKRLRIHNVLTSVRICDLADHVMRKPMKISFYKLRRENSLTLAFWQLHAARRLGLS